MVRVKYRGTGNNIIFDLIKVSDTMVVVQWMGRGHGKPCNTKDRVENVLDKIEHGTMEIVEGDVSKW